MEDGLIERKESTALEQFAIDAEANFKFLMGEEMGDEDAIDKFWNYVILTGWEGKRQFFKDVHFAKFGGFRDVKNLSNIDTPGGQSLWMRSIWAVILIFFALYNTYFLISSDVNPPKDTDMIPDYLISRTLVFQGMKWSGYEIHDIEAFEDSFNFVFLIQLLELTWLFINYFRLVRNTILAGSKTQYVCRYMRGTSIQKEQCRWIALAHIFWRNIPEIGALSGMRVLSIFTGPQIALELASIRKGKAKDTFKGYLWLTFKMLVCMIFGIDCFLVKFRIIAYETLMAENDDGLIHNVNQILVPLNFARQMASIIDIADLINQRLFVFIFGGEDSTMQQDERAKKEVWNAMMVQEMWRVYGAEQGACGIMKFTIVMSSYADCDFQKLVLDTRD